MTSSFSLIGGTVLTPDGASEIADIHVANGRIVDAKPATGQQIDCREFHVLPGIVDVHGDAFEVELYPRPGVEMDFRIAMQSVDRQLMANGITTACHGLTASWEPGARSLAAARRFMAGLQGLRPDLMANHHVQLRWEVFARDAINDIADWLATEPTPAIAFNDHTTETLRAIDAGEQEKLDKWAKRAGVSLGQYVAAVQGVSHLADAVPAQIREVAELAKRQGAVMLAHDESTIEERHLHRGLGMRISEFPLTADVAADAVGVGEYVVMGGPNVLRSGSHKGFMSAEDAIRGGICNVLASDYYYPSLFHAAERLVARGVLSMAEAWALISQNPAAALGLVDRGQIKPGNRADLVVVDCVQNWRLVQTFVGGAMARFDKAAR